MMIHILVTVEFTRIKPMAKVTFKRYTFECYLISMQVGMHVYEEGYKSSFKFPERGLSQGKIPRKWTPPPFLDPS